MIPGTPAVIASAQFSAVAPPAHDTDARPRGEPCSGRDHRAGRGRAFAVAAPATASVKPLRRAACRRLPACSASPPPRSSSAAPAVLVNVSCPAGERSVQRHGRDQVGEEAEGRPARGEDPRTGGRQLLGAGGHHGPGQAQLSADGIKLRKKPLIAVVALKPAAGAAVAKTLRAKLARRRRVGPARAPNDCVAASHSGAVRRRLFGMMLPDSSGAAAGAVMDVSLVGSTSRRREARQSHPRRR